MNKEQMINALNKLKEKINLGKLDNFNIEEKNQEIKNIDNRSVGIQNEIEFLQNKIKENNYKEGSPYDLAEKKRIELNDNLIETQRILDNNISTINSYNSIITANKLKIIVNNDKVDELNDDIINIGRYIRSLGENNLKDDVKYNTQLIEKRNELDSINKDTADRNYNINYFNTQLNNENIRNQELNIQVKNAKDKLEKISNNMEGLSLVNEAALQEDKDNLEDLLESQKKDKNRKKVLSINYTNELQGIINNLSEDRLSVKEASNQLQDLINNIPENYFIETEKDRLQELRENKIKQEIYSDKINRLVYKTDKKNQEKYFAFSEFRKEKIEDDLAKWKQRLSEYDRQLGSNENNIYLNQYNKNSEKIKEIEELLDDTRETSKDYQTNDMDKYIQHKDYFNKNKKLYENILQNLRAEQEELNPNEYVILKNKRERAAIVVSQLENNLKDENTLIDSFRLREAEKKIANYQSILKALEAREKFLNETAVDMINNTIDKAQEPNKKEDVAENIKDNEKIVENIKADESKEEDITTLTPPSVIVPKTVIIPKKKVEKVVVDVDYKPVDNTNLENDVEIQDLPSQDIKSQIINDLNNSGINTEFTEDVKTNDIKMEEKILKNLENKDIEIDTNAEEKNDTEKETDKTMSKPEESKEETKVSKVKGFFKKAGNNLKQIAKKLKNSKTFKYWALGLAATIGISTNIHKAMDERPEMPVNNDKKIEEFQAENNIRKAMNDLKNNKTEQNQESVTKQDTPAVQNSEVISQSQQSQFEGFDYNQEYGDNVSSFDSVGDGNYIDSSASDFNDVYSGYSQSEDTGNINNGIPTDTHDNSDSIASDIQESTEDVEYNEEGIEKAPDASITPTEDTNKPGNDSEITIEDAQDGESEDKNEIVSSNEEDVNKEEDTEVKVEDTQNGESGDKDENVSSNEDDVNKEEDTEIKIEDVQDGESKEDTEENKEDVSSNEDDATTGDDYNKDENEDVYDNLTHENGDTAEPVEPKITITDTEDVIVDKPEVVFPDTHIMYEEEDYYNKDNAINTQYTPVDVLPGESYNNGDQSFTNETDNTQTIEGQNKEVSSGLTKEQLQQAKLEFVNYGNTYANNVGQTQSKTM